MEETLRYNSPGTSPRMTTEDVTYRDVTIPKGTNLFFPISIAGRDPTSFPDADVFDPERERKNSHIAFGLGMHICLGQFIARAQIQEGLHLVAQRIKSPRRAGPSNWRPFYGVWGMRGLPITFTPA
jgi:cytochrome P450